MRRLPPAARRVRGAGILDERSIALAAPSSSQEARASPRHRLDELGIPDSESRSPGRPSPWLISATGMPSWSGTLFSDRRTNRSASPARDVPRACVSGPENERTPEGGGVNFPVSASRSSPSPTMRHEMACPARCDGSHAAIGFAVAFRYASGHGEDSALRSARVRRNGVNFVQIDPVIVHDVFDIAAPA